MTAFKKAAAAAAAMILAAGALMGGWLFGSNIVKPGAAATKPQEIIYENKTYGFSVRLPASWQGYKVIDEQWVGVSLSSGPDIYGPEILIRNPHWTVKRPWQDIPVMVFTLAQWKAVQADEYSLGAAPIGPSKLGQNAVYVFALPARYNFAFRTGYKEVAQILESGAFRAQPIG